MVEWSDNCQAKTYARQDFSKTGHIKGPLGLKKMKVGYWEYYEYEEYWELMYAGLTSPLPVSRWALRFERHAGQALTFGH